MDLLHLRAIESNVYRGFSRSRKDLERNVPCLRRINTPAVLARLSGFVAGDRACGHCNGGSLFVVVQFRYSRTRSSFWFSMHHRTSNVSGPCWGFFLAGLWSSLSAQAVLPKALCEHLLSYLSSSQTAEDFHASTSRKQLSTPNGWSGATSACLVYQCGGPVWGMACGNGTRRRVYQQGCFCCKCPRSQA